MILGGINNYCATEDVKYQMDNSYTRLCTTGLDVDQVKEMVNLGNADIINVNYDGTKLTELVIESNNHTFTLCPNGQFAMDGEECDGEIALVGDPIIEKAKELVYSNDICKTDGTTYQYMDGCYIKGNPNNNYIWYSGFLWRIMGINADGTLRLITEENVTAIPWGAEGTAENWDDSYAKDWLNNYFYPKLKGNNIIKEVTWCSETTTSSSSARTTCSNNLSTETAKVGLITIDEYNLAGGRSSYLNIGQYQYTMTPDIYDYNAWLIYYASYADYGDLLLPHALRPVIVIKSDVEIISGTGTFSNPYVI